MQWYIPYIPIADKTVTLLQASVALLGSRNTIIDMTSTFATPSTMPATTPEESKPLR